MPPLIASTDSALRKKMFSGALLQPFGQCTGRENSLWCTFFCLFCPFWVHQNKKFALVHYLSLLGSALGKKTVSGAPLGFSKSFWIQWQRKARQTAQNINCNRKQKAVYLSYIKKINCSFAVQGTVQASCAFHSSFSYML